MDSCSVHGGDIMNPEITDADLQTLLRENPLAAEQLRRIIAERQREELHIIAERQREELLAQIASQNGTAEAETEPAEVTGSGQG